MDQYVKLISFWSGIIQMPLIVRTKGSKHIFANISATNKDTNLKFVNLSQGYSHNILQAEIHPFFCDITKYHKFHIAAISDKVSQQMNLFTCRLVQLFGCLSVGLFT